VLVGSFEVPHPLSRVRRQLASADQHDRRLVQSLNRDACHRRPPDPERRLADPRSRQYDAGRHPRRQLRAGRHPQLCRHSPALPARRGHPARPELPAGGTVDLLLDLTGYFD
jgi:hypothetical protein